MFLDAYDNPDAFETGELAHALLTWSSSIVSL